MERDMGDPQLYLERLAGEVALREVAALVEQAPSLSDDSCGPG
jgi:hypothetical protein